MSHSYIVFPGQGSQYPTMAKDWFDNFKEAQLTFQEGSEGAKLDLKRLIFDGTDNDLKQTEVTQPAILTASIAIFRSLTAQLAPLPATPYLFAGHSLGEFSALVAAGALSLLQATSFTRARGIAMQEAVKPGVGRMAALIFKPGTDGAQFAQEICAEASKQTGKTVQVANYNSREQVVISGYAEAVDVAAKLGQAGAQYNLRKAVPLAVSAPFHSDLMRPAADKLRAQIKSLEVVAPQKAVTYIANVDAKPHVLSHPDTATGVRERLFHQIYSPVQWLQSTEFALGHGAQIAVEVGPGAVLTGLNKRIKKDGLEFRSCLNVDRLDQIREKLKSESGSLWS